MLREYIVTVSFFFFCIYYTLLYHNDLWVIILLYSFNAMTIQPLMKATNPSCIYLQTHAKVSEQLDNLTVI